MQTEAYLIKTKCLKENQHSLRIQMILYQINLVTMCFSFVCLLFKLQDQFDCRVSSWFHLTVRDTNKRWQWSKQASQTSQSIESLYIHLQATFVCPTVLTSSVFKPITATEQGTCGMSTITAWWVTIKWGRHLHTSEFGWKRSRANDGIPRELLPS